MSTGKWAKRGDNTRTNMLKRMTVEERLRALVKVLKEIHDKSVKKRGTASNKTV